jgi:hypothetical protein
VVYDSGMLLELRRNRIDHAERVTGIEPA